MSYSNTYTSFRGKVNNYNCDRTLVTDIEGGSYPSSQPVSSRRLVNAAAPCLSALPETSSLMKTLMKTTTQTGAEPSWTPPLEGVESELKYQS
ncbi:hypothetical protein GEMRC1_011133 [Eukaryota sp. GEM-RC1]